MQNRLVSGLIAMVAIGMVAGTNGCSTSDIPGPSALCCTAFQPGTDMSTADFGVDASIKGQMSAFANATGDLSAVAGTALADVTSACRNIAVDMGDDPTGGTGGATGGANGKSGVDLLNYWCDEAANSVTTVIKASGTVTLTVVPPECDVSIQATASCQGSCDVSGSCNVQANPPTCTGGTLEASCTGTCTASASAPTFDCTGSCSGTCSGSCTVQTGGVDCTGKCQGTCTAKAGVGNGTGAQADGTCQGSCTGTCSVTAPSATCSGTCSGQCNANCTAAPGQASATCSGTCSAKATPISCKGGKLSGGCQVDANCQANCNASAKAKASCTPPSVTLVATGTASASFNTLAITLQKNLPALINVILGQGKDFADDISAAIQGGATLTTSGSLGAGGTICVADMVAAATSGSANFAATLSASVKVSTAAGGPGS
jgi:hypothetical protein